MSADPRVTVREHLAALESGGMPWLPILHSSPDVATEIYDDLWVEWAVSDLIDQWNAEEAS